MATAEQPDRVPGKPDPTAEMCRVIRRHYKQAVPVLPAKR